MVKQGLKPRWSSHKDWDFLKSQKLSGATKPVTYTPFSVDAGFPMMNQDAMGFPFGCTGFAQGELCSDEDKIIYDPGYIYLNTPPKDPAQGRDIRQSLSFICNNDLKEYLKGITPNSKRTGYFSIRAQGQLDWFDAIYVSMLSTLNENRGVSIGWPWFPEFETIGTDGILPMPQDFRVARATWHNAVILKLVLIMGQPYFGIKSHQGSGYGDNGWCYASPELVNQIMELQGTEAFTVSKVVPGQVSTIDLTIIELIVSFIKNLFGV